MELIAKVLFRCPQFTMYPGDSTKDLKAATEDMKRQMITDYPDWFEIVQEAGKVETPEDNLSVETSEKRIGRLGKR